METIRTHLRQNIDTIITNEIILQYFENDADDRVKTTKLPNSLPAVQLNRDLKSIKESLTVRNSKNL